MRKFVSVVFVVLVFGGLGVGFVSTLDPDDPPCLPCGGPPPRPPV